MNYSSQILNTSDFKSTTVGLQNQNISTLTVKKCPGEVCRFRQASVVGEWFVNVSIMNRVPHHGSVHFMDGSLNESP